MKYKIGQPVLWIDLDGKYIKKRSSLGVIIDVSNYHGYYVMFDDDDCGWFAIASIDKWVQNYNQIINEQK